MAFSKRILDKIHDKCRGDDAMVDYMHQIVTYEFEESKQYTKAYENALMTCSKKSRESQT